MAQRDECTSERMLASKQGEDRARDLVARAVEVPADDSVCKPARIEPVAFELEERELRDRIQDPQVVVELEGVDHDGERFEAHVLGAKVAVRIDNPPVGVASVEDTCFTSDGGDGLVNELRDDGLWRPSYDELFAR